MILKFGRNLIWKELKTLNSYGIHAHSLFRDRLT